MNAYLLNRSANSLYRTILAHTALALAVLGFTAAMPSPACAETLEEASVSTPPELKQAAQDLRADYRQQQWDRLSQKTDRDSLIAAVLLGMPNDTDSNPIDGNADVEQRLARNFGHDPLVLFTLALSCQLQKEPCAHPERYDALVRIAPFNAVHWLLLPNGATPNDAQLHAAAIAPQADTHLREMVRIVRAALVDQPAPSARIGVDPRELALLLRRDAVGEEVMLPKFAAVMKLCKGVAGQRRDDCIELGRRLEADRSGSILSRMIGSAIVRRMLKGTPEEVAAKELRRDYVWFSDQLVASKVPYEEQKEIDTVVYGEWEAAERAVERMGMTRTPPAGWMPKNPQTLLLSEERTPAPAQ
jgi:hypothetical protein